MIFLRRFYATHSPNLSKLDPFKKPIKTKSQTLSNGLYVVATPIGNLSDFSERALNTLSNVSSIYSEDTRVTAKLLEHYSITTPLHVYHHHLSSTYESNIIKQLIPENNNNSKAIALVTDAGTPCISDPGKELILCAHQSNVPVYCIPGPSAVVAALSVSGFDADRFIFEGFLPRKKMQRRNLLEVLSKTMNDYTIVFFETKYNIVETIEECISVWGKDHLGCYVRELTFDL